MARFMTNKVILPLICTANERERGCHAYCMYVCAVHAKGSSYPSSSTTNVKKTMIQISGQGKKNIQ